MKRYRSLLPVLGIAILLLSSTDAMAQQVSSFEQLQLLVRPGDKVTVTSTTSLKTTIGKITELSPDLLKVSDRGVEHKFSQADVLIIKQKRSDPLSNGAKWGALVGFAGTSTVVAIGCSVYGGCSAAEIVAAGIVYTGIGAGIGVGIDAMIVGNQTIYRTPNRTASGIHIAPVLSNHRKGVSLSMSF